MTESEMELAQSEETPRALHFEWLFPVLFRPRRTLEQVLQKQNAVWLTPMLVLSVLALAFVLIASPIRQAQAQMQANGALPPNFEYMTPEEQSQFQQGMQVTSGPVFTYVLPAISALGGLWLQWVLLGSFLHLALTLAGSRGSSTHSFNLVAWASVPLALRFIVQAGYMLVTHQLITSPGLCGFVATEAGGGTLFLSALLALIDLYFLWMVVLILVGVRPMTGLPQPKAWTASLVMVLLLLALQALPPFLMSQFSGAGSYRPFFF